ncbi:MAG TPA: hypothetical protein VNU49_07470 [Opitutaceae bacterium]|jgi:hypothetical protein|nr:hypothetical protein [Opitutaceae bacterium]
MNYKNPASILCTLVLSFTALFAGGCASIVHSGNRTININTEPVGAKATISKPDGTVVSMQTTPCTFSLDPKRGYFKGQNYILTLELTGYKTTEVELQPELSGWYFGNIVFGGIIGLIIVDPITGSMWNITPDKIDQPLSSSQAALIREHKGFVVVLVSQITDNERNQMVRIN